MMHGEDVLSSSTEGGYTWDDVTKQTPVREIKLDVPSEAAGVAERDGVG